MRPIVTSANRHQKKYEVNNPKVSSILLTGSFKAIFHVSSMSLTTHIKPKPKDSIFLVKYSRYSVYTSNVFNGVVSNKVRYTSVPNIHKCKL